MMHQRRQHPGRHGKPERLSVGVVVDLYCDPMAGGHVKCWERLAEAARGLPLDLTVYFLGQRAETVPLAENVRYVLLRPVLGTDRFSFLDGVADHTDLAPTHPALNPHLARHHLLHSTDAFFALARTAMRFARRRRRPLVSSLHTDTPGYTRVYAALVLRRIFGEGRMGELVLDRWGWDQRLARRMQRQLRRYLERSDWVLGARWGDGAQPAELPEGRSSVLRRGIDKELFHPRRRDRARLEQSYGIAPDRVVLLFAGRVDAGKDVMTLARAARQLAERGAPIHAVFAGEGAQKEEVRALLGSRATLTGAVPQEELAWLYASADVFVFPSRIEIAPNVVVEARAAGLPVMVSAVGHSAALVSRPGPDAEEDGLVVASNNPGEWAAAIGAVVAQPERRRAMGTRSRQHIEREWPSWRDVLEQDLLPVWQRVARNRGVWG